MVCPHGEGGLSQFGHFADKGDQFFAILYGRFLWRTLKKRVDILLSLKYPVWFYVSESLIVVVS